MNTNKYGGCYFFVDSKREQCYEGYFYDFLDPMVEEREDGSFFLLHGFIVRLSEIFPGIGYTENIYFYKTYDDACKANPVVCPTEGEFIGYKKIYVALPKNRFIRGSKRYIKNRNGLKREYRHVIAKLLIPADAQRTSGLGDSKCRASKAKVLDIFDSEGNHYSKGANIYYCYKQTDYVVGKVVRADNFDEDRRQICTNGIHFFMSLEEAENYRTW